MTLSIIIPTYNEAASIGKLVSHLALHGKNAIADLIVADGGSQDDTVALAQEAGAKVVVSPTPGRAAQMNFGARCCKGDILYFVHADAFPPATFVSDIQHAVSTGYSLGRYYTKFNSSKLILNLNAWFTRFDFFICMGGDQTLFVTKTLFEQCKGFNEDMKIMEEYEFCQRARKQGKYKIMNGAALISARKYETNSWLQVQLANARVVRMYKQGASQQEMLDTYKQMLSYRNNAF